MQRNSKSIVSFLMESGVKMILQDLKNALDRGVFKSYSRFHAVNSKIVCGEDKREA